jgi:hypothetical protein
MPYDASCDNNQILEAGKPQITSKLIIIYTKHFFFRIKIEIALKMEQ